MRSWPRTLAWSSQSRCENRGGKQIPKFFVNYGFCGHPEERAHDTHPVLIVRDRRSKCIGSHPVPSKGVVHPYCRSLRRRQEWLVWRSCAGRLSSPMGESKSNGEVERAVQSVHGLGGSSRTSCNSSSNHSRIPKSAAGLVGVALFQSSSTLPQR